MPAYLNKLSINGDLGGFIIILYTNMFLYNLKNLKRRRSGSSAFLTTFLTTQLNKNGLKSIKMLGGISGKTLIL